VSRATERVGARIADLRRNRSRTQEDVAAHASINRVTLARIEAGANVSLELLSRIARALGVTLVDLVR
jgi:transcriptional regulator with XRE-family HTH domain